MKCSSIYVWPPENILTGPVKAQLGPSRILRVNPLSILDIRLSRVDPRFYGNFIDRGRKIVCNADVRARGAWTRKSRSRVVKRKGLPNQAFGKGRAVLQCSLVAANDVIWIPIAWPPG